MPEQEKPDTELLANLGKNLTKFIQLRGFRSAEEFAWSIKLPKTTLSRIIRGKGDVRISKLNRIAKALDVKIDRLLQATKK